MKVLRSIVERHAEDAAFFWCRRQLVLRGDASHAARVRLDERLEASLDGLRGAGSAGWSCVQEELGRIWRDGAVFAAAVLALGEPDEGRAEWLDEAARSGPGAFRAVVSAAGWSAGAAVAASLSRWAASGDAVLRRLGIAGGIARRALRSDTLDVALADPEGSVRATAARACGELGRREHAGRLGDLLADGDPEVRVRAALALARLGEPEPRSESVLVAAAEEGSAPYAEACVGALVRSSREGGSLLRRWAATRPHLAACAAEVMGDPALVPTLIAWMEDDVVARRAGSAFCAITGAHLTDDHLMRERPAYVPGDPNDDPEDPRVKLDEEYTLRFPSALKAAAWWRGHRDAFSHGGRFLDGVVIGGGAPWGGSPDVEALLSVVRRGRPRHALLAARELGARFPDGATVETHAPAIVGTVLPGEDAYDGVARSIRSSAAALQK